MKTKKVCHIISGFYRNNERIFWKQCRSLVHAGYDVTLLTNDGGKEETVAGVKIVATGFTFSNRFQRILLSKELNYKKVLEINPDIIQIHEPAFIPLGLKFIKHGKKLIYDSHEDFPRQILEKDWIPGLLRRPLSKLAEIYFIRTLKKYDAVIAVTPHIAESLKKASNNVHCVTNYPIVDNSMGIPSLDEYLRRDNLLCYAGTVYTCSLQDRIITAIKGLHNLNYTIVGNIDDDYKAYLLSNFDTQNVNFKDHVPREKLMDIYKNATIGMAIFDYLPNVGYKMGTLGSNKFFEYMCFSLPVICTDFILWKKIIDKYKCGICVKSNNIDEIRSAVKYLIENKEEAYQMGQNARRAILEECNWDTQEKIYLDVINKLSAP